MHRRSRLPSLAMLCFAAATPLAAGMSPDRQIASLAPAGSTPAGAAAPAELFGGPFAPHAVYLRPRGSTSAAACPTMNLPYRGGPVIPSAKVVEIFWGPSFNNPSSLDYPYARALIAFRNLLGGTPEYNVITQYSQSGGQFVQLSNLAAGTADWFDTSTPPTNVTDATVQAEVRAYLATHAVDYSTVYEVFIPSSSYSSFGSTNSCVGTANPASYCAYHTFYGSGSTAVKYAILPYPSCSDCIIPTVTAAQTEEVFVVHETREAASDPALNAWTYMCGSNVVEADDQCQSVPSFYGSGGYLYQQEWSNEAHGCVQTRGSFGSVGFADNGASYAAVVSPEGIASVFGQNLASTTTSTSGNPLPTSLGGVNVTVGGLSAGLSYVSPTQINLVLPGGAPASSSQLIFIYNNGTLAATGAATVQAVAPGLFSFNGSGSGLAAAYWQRYDSNGNLLANNNTSVPIDFGNPTDSVYLILYGTGIRGAGSAVSVTVNGQAGQVAFAGAQPSYEGLDQVNVLLPRSLAGSGSGVPVVLSAAGVGANVVTVSFQ